MQRGDAKFTVISERRDRPVGDGAAADAARARLGETLQRTGEQDRQAFLRLYRLTSSKLFGICLRICGDRQAAEDVLQEVYVTIWRRAGGYEPSRGSPITWLATIARNRAIDWRRAKGSATMAPIDEAHMVVEPALSAPDLMMLDEADRKLHRCLDMLDPHQRDAIRTAFFEGLTYAELADRSGVPLGTMKSWVRRGLLRLRDCLDDDS